MKIALVGPELEENLALRYINASVARAGHEARIFDFHAPEQINEIARAIIAHKVDVVGLSMVFTARAREFVDLALHLRELGFAGHITAGGHFASFHARELLEDYGAIDSIVHGEGEETLVELLDSLDHPDRVAGVSWRSADGEIRSTGPRCNSDDLDGLARPTRDPGHCHDYLGLRIANILSGRGCYGNCRFCSIVAWHKQNGGRRFRQRSVESLASEMIDLYHERDVRIFNFHDDNFFMPTREANLERFGRLKELLDAGRVGRIAIQVKSRPDSVEPDVFALLKQIGLFRVFLGVETAAVDGLRLLGRGIRREQNFRAMKILERLGLHTTFNLLMFDPDGELGGIRENVTFMRRYARFPLNFCRVEVYAGTDIERQLREQDRLIGDSFGYTYRIADPRVQLMYEMFRKIFTPRNFDATGANLRAMQIDYYYHILDHFYPERTSGLRRQVKRRIAALNRNSASLLGEMCRIVDRSPLPDAEVVQSAVEDMTARRAEFDRVWTARVDSLLTTMRTRATVPGGTRGRRISIAASVAATLLTVTVGGCRDTEDPESHMHEMAPAPLDPAQPDPEPPEPAEPDVPAEPADPVDPFDLPADPPADSPVDPADPPIELPDWHMCEMAPFEPELSEPDPATDPFQTPDVHMHEMIPVDPSTQPNAAPPSPVESSAPTVSPEASPPEMAVSSDAKKSNRKLNKSKRRSRKSRKKPGSKQNNPLQMQSDVPEESDVQNPYALPASGEVPDPPKSLDRSVPSGEIDRIEHADSPWQDVYPSSIHPGETQPLSEKDADAIQQNIV